MGYPQGHKQKTRERIVLAARKLWKRDGYDGASVDKVMAEAGLTRGGFYAHFKSKDDLLVEALSETLAAETINRLKEEGINDEKVMRQMIVDFYISKMHRDHPDRGCPLTALTQEAARFGSGPRKVLACLVDRFSRWLAGGQSSRQNGLTALSLMVGAVTLARAIEDESLSDEILEVSKKEVKRILQIE